MIRTIIDFIRWESSAGIILMAVTVLALIVSNSPLEPYYADLLSLHLSVSIGQASLSKALLLWINDGLMVIFFLLVGLEIKRELLEGELNTLSKAMLPAIAALGGMLIPALIYVFLNYQDTTALRGWAIPAATDIAFALGILTLLGSRVPTSLKVLLTAIAILDDLAAILIIAVFYTSDLSIFSLVLAFLCLFILFIFNRLNITRFTPYALVGAIMWVCVLNSGVHATLVGVAIAMAYPIRDKKNPSISPLREMEGNLHPWVAFAVLPLFAFANAGVNLDGIGLSVLLTPVPLGIAAGLFLGKQAGIFLSSWAAIKLGFAKMPVQSSWLSLYGIALLCGIGFTMSLFIGTLAFGQADVDYCAHVRLGVLLGSLLSGVVGYLVLCRTCPSVSTMSQ